MPELPNSLNNKNEKIARFESLLNDSKRHLTTDSNLNYPNTVLIVSISDQELYVVKNQEIIISYTISSAEAGIGNKSGSFQTPTGAHQISEKIGKDAQFASIFKARENTHATAEILKTPTRSQRDNITSRILRLDGLEQGINKGTDENGNIVDSNSRYIYIHGTDEEGLLGQAASHGCIRMSNQDIIELFDLIEIACLVLITED